MVCSAFSKRPFFFPIIVTVPIHKIQKARKLLQPFVDIRIMIFIEGGKTRQQSVHSALEVMETDPPDYVLIHDGARPWLDLPLLREVVAHTQKFSACIPVMETVDALKEISGTSGIVKHLNRKNIVAAQTPQGFNYAKILAAHREAEKDNRVAFIDDSEIYSTYIGPVHTIQGNPTNRKITYNHDLGTQ